MSSASAILRSLFPKSVSSHIETLASFSHTVTEVGAVDMIGAVPSRRREFAAGRACAREALAILGAPSLNVGRNLDRSPIWPEGFVGSISHCDALCCAVAARAEDFTGLGVDVEAFKPLNVELQQMIGRASEFVTLEPLQSAGGGGVVLFSAKEAIYKCYYPVHRTMLEFRDVEVLLNFETTRSGSFSARLLADTAPGATYISAVEGRWRIDGGFVYCGAGVRGSRSS